MPATPTVAITIRIPPELYEWLQAQPKDMKATIVAALQHMRDMEDDR